MKINLTLLLIFLNVLAITAQEPEIIPDLGVADSIPYDSLVISEVGPAQHRRAGFVELTNMGSDTINLSNFFMQGRYAFRTEAFGISNGNRHEMVGLLAPGESYINIIAIPSFDLIIGDIRFEQLTDDGWFANKELWNYADIRCFLKQGMQYVLFSRYRNPETGTIDSSFVDGFNFFESNQAANDPIAGINESVEQFNWVRKTVVKVGNTDWNASRGTDALDSEWMALKAFAHDYYSQPYSTIKNHGEGDVKSIAPKGDISIDFDNQTITMPYGSAPRDSVFRHFTYGPNIGWDFLNGPVDTIEYYVQTGDTLVFYEADTALVAYKFPVTVLPKTNSFNKARPLVLKRPNFTYYTKWTVSDGYETDTIGQLPYGVRKDTLLNYLVIEDDCTFEFIHKDGVESPDLDYGDILRIEAPSGDKKDYLITPEPYEPSHNALIKTVILPGLDIFENPETFFFTDTFYNFAPTSAVVNISLPPEVESVPSLLLITENDKATIVSKRAVNLTGTAEQRTTTVTVTAEDDTTQATYDFVFTLEREAPELDYTLFFSDLGVWWSYSQQYTMQIFNPHDDLVDMSDYFICQANDIGALNQENYMSAGGALANPNQWVFRPGYMVMQDIDGKYIFQYDFNQSNTYLLSKDIYNISSEKQFPFNGFGSNTDLFKFVDYRVIRSGLPKNDPSDVTGVELPDLYGTGHSMFYFFNNWRAGSKGKSYWLYKITNDSVKDGSKEIIDLDNDYELIDVLNGWSGHMSVWEIADTVDGKDTIYDGEVEWISASNIYRKPNVYRGNPVDRASFGIVNSETGEVVKPGEWVDYGGEKIVTAANTITGTRTDQDFEGATSRKRFNYHEMNYTEHIPYLLSSTYLISAGITGSQSIKGVPAATTVNTFMQNIIKPNPGMTVNVVTSSDIIKTGTETLDESDKIYSYSVRGEDSVIYDLSIGDLDNSIALTSDVYTVAIENSKAKGTISNIPFGISLEELLSNLTAPELAKVFTTDGEDGIIPMQMYTYDTIMIENMERPKTLASTSTFVEVVAENGDKCVYSLEFASSEVPMLASEVYKVNNDERTISYVYLTSVDALLGRLIAQPGYSLKVINKIGQDRTDGIIYLDDKVVMYNTTNPSESYAFYINVIGNGIVDAIKENAVSIARTYPNPTTQLVTVEAQGLQLIEVRDITGRTIEVINTNKDAVSINLKGKSGMYLLTVKHSKGVETLKVIKE